MKISGMSKEKIQEEIDYACNVRDNCKLVSLRVLIDGYIEQLYEELNKEKEKEIKKMNSEAYEEYLNQEKCKEAYSLCKKCGNRVFQHKDMEFCKKRDDINCINLRGNYRIHFREVEDVCEFYEPISFIERIRRKINE